MLLKKFVTVMQINDYFAKTCKTTNVVLFNLITFGSIAKTVFM